MNIRRDWVAVNGKGELYAETLQSSRDKCRRTVCRLPVVRGSTTEAQLHKRDIFIRRIRSIEFY